MNKIIITGHPSSGFEDVEALLQRNGMLPALPSRREGQTAREIHETLRRAHRLPDPRTVCDERELLPASVQPIWKELTMDLLAGNLGREPWGLADSGSIYFLANWHDLVEDTLFVFVYAPPSFALSVGPIETEEEAIRQRLDSWAAYNGAMLRFYMRHRARSILLHVKQVCNDDSGLLGILKQRLSCPLHPSACEAGSTSTKPTPAHLTEEILLALGESSPADESDGHRRPIDADFLCERMLDDKPEHLLLYSELQAAADLPNDSEATPRVTSETWASWAEERRLSTLLLGKYRDLVADHRESGQRNLLDSLKLSQCRDEVQLLQIELQRQSFLHENPPPLTGAAARAKQELPYRLGHTLVKRSRNPLALIAMPVLLAREAWRHDREQHARGKLPPLSEYSDFDLAKPVTKQLSYRLGDAIVRNSRSPLGWLNLPFALIRQASAYHRSRRESK